MKRGGEVGRGFKTKNKLFIHSTFLYIVYNMKQIGKRYIYPVDLKEVDEALEMIVEKIGCSKADAIRDAIGFYADYLSGLEVIRYREIGREEAKEEIKTYIKGKDRASADRFC